MIEPKNYLTFKTDKSISDKLKIIAKACNMTQPELLESICKDFIEKIDSELEKMNNIET